jgi:hypothetical protein
MNTDPYSSSIIISGLVIVSARLVFLPFDPWPRIKRKDSPSWVVSYDCVAGGNLIAILVLRLKDYSGDKEQQP